MLVPTLSGFGVTGQARSMFANRISYFFNLTGPSCNFYSSWTGAIQIIQLATESIINGQCDAAIVGSCNMTKNASLSWLAKEMGLLADDDKTRAFDDNGKKTSHHYLFQNIIIQLSFMKCKGE